MTGVQVIIDSSKDLTWFADQALLLNERGIPLDIVISMRPNAALMHSALKRGQPETRAVRAVLYYLDLIDTLRGCRFRKAVAVDSDEFCRNPPLSFDQVQRD